MSPRSPSSEKIKLMMGEIELKEALFWQELVETFPGGYLEEVMFGR